eukprot:Awhi_evm1s11831
MQIVWKRLLQQQRKIDCTNGSGGTCNNNSCSYSGCNQDSQCSSLQHGYCDNGTCASGECSQGSDCPSDNWSYGVCTNHVCSTRPSSPCRREVDESGRIVRRC